MPRETQGSALARSHGFLAVAADGQLGEIETPLFPPDWREPDYLIVKTITLANQRLRRPVLPVSLVEAVDQEQKVVYLRGAVKQLAHMPETLPLTGRRGRPVTGRSRHSQRRPISS